MNRIDRRGDGNIRRAQMSDSIVELFMFVSVFFFFFCYFMFSWMSWRFSLITWSTHTRRMFWFFFRCRTADPLFIITYHRDWYRGWMQDLWIIPFIVAFFCISLQHLLFFHRHYQCDQLCVSLHLNIGVCVYYKPHIALMPECCSRSLSLDLLLLLSMLVLLLCRSLFIYKRHSLKSHM